MKAGPVWSDETWIYESGDWTQLSPATSPSARGGHAMVWDGSRILLYGGFLSGTGNLDDLWEFSGGTWTDITPGTVPGKRQLHKMVWDGSRVLLFGGLVETAGPTFTIDDETWEYTGGAWNQLSPVDSPPNVPGGGGPATGREFMAMVWNGNRVVLQGGRSNSNVYPTNPSYESGGSTWVYEAANWSQPGPSSTPSDRYKHMATVTDDDGKMILFSGDVSPTGSLGEIIDPSTWAYDDTDWTQLAPTTDPGSRLQADMVWDGSRAILFGGDLYASPTSHAPSDETWEFAGPSPVVIASLRHTFGLG